VSREEKLASVLAEFAHTLGRDLSIQEVLDRLVQWVIEVLPVTAAGVMVMRGDDELHYVAASNETVHEIESLQNAFDEGPCLDAYRTGEAVAVPDLRVDDRFPGFSPRALAAGVAAVFTFPMRLNGHRLGALDVYRDTSGQISAGDMRAAQVLADVAAAYLFNVSARSDAADKLTQLRHRNLHDPLTGLPNRTLLAELLEHAVARARRSHLAAAVLFVDLDRFKSINDRFGHHAGDRMLVAVSARLGRVLRPGDTLARLAGDEFVILCEDLSQPSQAELIAERIAQTLADPFDVGGRLVQITASVGIAFSGPGENIPELLLRDADLAMYQVKAAGGGHHRVVDRSARFVSDGRAQLENDMRNALERNDFQLAYQPIAHARGGGVVAVEALLRWRHPDRGLVPPDVIIPIAERTGLMLPLGKWVLRQACQDYVRWRGTYGDALAQVAVNVSAHQVMDPAFAVTVADALSDTGIDPTCLHLEVTESVFLEDAARARAVLGEVKELGVRLSLDDFGTGYSPLTYLQRFPFELVKISRSFIADLTGDAPITRAIVASVIGLARALDLTVVAGGVETQQQLTEVIDLGGDLVQGYLLGRPLFTADLEEQVLDRVGTSQST
jgi:diguanylate cyclase (GGDEF)-like protein